MFSSTMTSMVFFDLLCMNVILFVVTCYTIKVKIEFKKVIIFSLVSLISLSINMVSDDLFINDLFMISLSSILIGLILSIKFKNALIPFLMNYCIFKISYNFYFLLFSTNLTRQYVNNEIAISVFCTIIGCITTLIIIKVLSNIYQNNSYFENVHTIESRVYYYLSSLTFGIIIILAYISRSVNSRGSTFLLYTINIFALLLISSFITFIKTYHERFLVSIENKSLLENIKDIEILNEDLRSLKHDFLNHLQVVSGLLQLKKYSECFDYITNLNNEGMCKKSIKTGLISVNALLNSKQLRAKHSNIKLDLEIDSTLDDANLNIQDWELTRILGNLIDNAIYEEKKVSTPSKYVKVKIDENKHFYNLSVYNKNSYVCSDKKKKIFNSGFSTKGDNGSGMGLYIVNSIVNKYNGYLEIDSDISSGTQFNVYFPKGNKFKDLITDTISYPPQESLRIQN